MRERAIAPIDIYPRYGKRLARKSGLRRLAARFQPLPRHTYLPLKAELKMVWLRLKTRGMPRRFRDARELLVNIAPGECGHEGWVNVDARARPGITGLYDCRQQLPFPDGSVRFLFTEHFFEHLDYTEEVPRFVSECYRVLAPRGILRIVVPDAELYLRAYCEPDWSSLERARPLESGHWDPYVKSYYHTKMELINMVFRQGFQHKWAYDYDTLEWVLREYGFEQVARRSFQDSAEPSICIDRPVHESESLYVEATRD